MIIFAGDSRSINIITKLKQHGWGRFVIERDINLYEGEPWGFDNGAYVDWVRGREFDGGAFYQRLKKFYAKGTPYLAVCPDLVTKGKESLAFSLSYMTHVLNQDWPWYLAVQDGMDIQDVEPVLHRFSGIFLGGSNEFKWSAPAWCELAHRHGKLFHYGRINSKRLAMARKIGADSADGTGLLWEEYKFTDFVRAFYTGKTQQELFGED